MNKELSSKKVYEEYIYLISSLDRQIYSFCLGCELLTSSQKYHTCYVYCPGKISLYYLQQAIDKLNINYKLEKDDVQIIEGEWRKQCWMF